MFFHVPLEKNMLLHPRFFGPKLRDTLTQQLLQDVEGRCDGKNGFIVAVTKVEPKGAGEITSGSGSVKFPVQYHALVFRPFKGEVLECVVTQVFKVRTSAIPFIFHFSLFDDHLLV
jgi:DNA-directed RNA polymerase II subunit RPB7